jgi:hypothetical protein
MVCRSSSRAEGGCGYGCATSFGQADRPNRFLGQRSAVARLGRGYLQTMEAEVLAASMRLPERQREALELHERGQRSYEEVAAIMGTSSSSVAQLIFRARINLYDGLRGTALASVAAPSPECERALPLIAMREDEQLTSPQDAAWLDSHLAGCERCTLADEQMLEAGAIYKAAVPAATPQPTKRAAPAGRRAWPQRRLMLASGLAALLLVGVALALGGANWSSSPPAPVTDTASKHDVGRGNAGATVAKTGKAKRDAAGRGKTERRAVAHATARGADAVETTSAPGAAQAPAATADGVPGGGGASGGAASDPNHPADKAAVDQTEETAASKPPSKPKPAPVSTTADQPAASAQAPTPEPPPSTEEQPDEPGHRGEPPGKPADRPPR